MRLFHPVRALRRSGWPSRAVLALVVAGVIAAPLGTGPAGAHGTGVHTLIVRGTMHITDIDGGSGHPTDPFPDICNFTNITQAASFQRTGSAIPRVNIDIVRDCDEVTGFLRVNAQWRSDRAVNADGFARVTERDCFIGRPFCVTNTLPQRDFRSTILENVTGQRATTTIQRTDIAIVRFDFEIFVQG
jgi:hypothetical protein